LEREERLKYLLDVRAVSNAPPNQKPWDSCRSI
jgi:hypothetical protein